MGRYQTNTSKVQNSSQQQNFFPENWPSEFPNCVIGIDRDGVINEWKNIIKRYEDVQFIEGSLEAIRQLRLKGHRVVLFADQPNIVRGLLSNEDVNNVMNYFMQAFGEAGIFSIDGFFYNQSDNPQDPYAKPNIGMMKRSENELNVDYSKGYYIGDTIDDIKMAQKIGSTPILVRTGRGAETERKYLKSFDSKYSDVKVFDNLLEFSKSI